MFKVKANNWWVLFPGFVGAFSYSMVSAPFQQLIISIICQLFTETPNVNEECRSPEIDSSSSYWILILMLCLTVPSLLTVGTYGSLSDKIGRTRVMLFPTIGLLLNRLATCLAIYFEADRPEYLIAGQLLQGLFGGMPTLFMTCFAYTADCSDSTKRSAHFGILEAFLFMGFVVGPFVGGAITAYGKIWPFVVSGALNVLMLVLVLFTPESLEKEKRSTRFQWKKANVFGTMGVLFYSRTVILLSLAFALVVLCYNAFINVFVLYADITFGWKEYEDGIFLSVQWTARSIGVGLLLPLLLRMKGWWVEGWIARVGTLAYVGAFLMYGFASVEWVFFAATALDGIGAMTLPVFRSLLSRSVPSHEQGRVLSATGALEGVAEIFAPLVFNFALAFLVSKDPSIVFFMMCGTLGLAFLATLFLRKEVKEGEMKPLLSDATSSKGSSSDGNESSVSDEERNVGTLN